MPLSLIHAEGFGISSGVVQAFLAVLLWKGRRIRPDWGLAWLAAAFAMAATLNIIAPTVNNADMPIAWRHGINLVLGVGCMAALLAGLRRYAGLHTPSSWIVVAVMPPIFLTVAGILYLLGLGEFSGHAASCLVFSYGLLICHRHLHRVSGDSSGALLISLLLYPTMVAAAALAGQTPFILRYWASGPFTLVGVGIVVASLGRLHKELEAELRRRQEAEQALRQLNESLEQRIDERTEELHEVVRGLEAFNGMVSHDLRGPLGGMHSLTQLTEQALQQGDLPRAERMVAEIGAEAHRLAHLVGNLLQLARVSHAELNLQHTALNSVLDDALQTLAVSLGQERAACVRHDALPQARVDAGLLRQVFVNLIGNALKFSQVRPSAEVRVLSPREGETPSEIVIEVRDNGVGFTAEEAAQLFQPFRRLHGHQFSGDGVGLTIVKRIIERHGGRVWAEGRPGQGASFFFSLPNHS